MKILLNAITLAAKNKEVTIDEVVSSYNEGSEIKYETVKIGEKQIVQTEPIIQQNYINQTTEQVTSRPSQDPTKESIQSHGNFDAVAVIGAIGAFILATGAAVLIGKSWDTMSTNQQLFSSLGIGLILFYISYYLSYRFKYNVISNIMIIISGFWLSWGILFTVDKTIGDKNSKVLVFGIALAILVAIYAILYRYFTKGLYFLAMSTVGFVSYMFLANYILVNADSDQFGKLMTIGVITAAISGLLLLAYNHNNLEAWVRNLTLIGEYIVFTVSTFAYLTVLNLSWVNGSEKIAEYAYSILFFVWYWIAIKTKSKVLLIINSIGFYIYISNIASKYNNDIAYTLIVSGMLLILISLATYYISRNMNKKIPLESNS